MIDLHSQRRQRLNNTEAYMWRAAMQHLSIYRQELKEFTMLDRIRNVVERQTYTHIRQQFIEDLQ